MNGVPSREKVLRDLFWKLLFRGRSAREATAHRRRKQLGMGTTFVLYAVFGLFPAAGAFSMQPLAFASSLHTITLLFASLTLASSVGSMLFVREEAEILLHRPVEPAELLRAKCTVLVSFSLLLALALNALGLVASFWNEGNRPLFAVAHVATTLLLMLSSAAAIVLVYNVCLRWFGRERFENLLTFVQVMLTILMVAGGQMLPRMMNNEALRAIDPTHPIALLVPPVWFGALDMLLCGAMPAEQVWLPAAIGAGVTALLVWLAFVKLGSSYGVGLLAIGEASSPVPDRPRRRLLSALLAQPPLRWWLRDPIERHAFLLTSAYLVRDRETKLKLYPALAPMLVLPLFIAIGPSRRGASAGPNEFLEAVALGYVAIVPVQALMLLQRSEHWRTADLFLFAPLPHWSALFHGARKAVVCWLALPAIAIVGGGLAVMRGTWSPLFIGATTGITVVVCSWIPGLGDVWLPLSKPNEDQRQRAVGCLVFVLVLIPAMAFGGLAAWLDTLGFYWPFLGVGLCAAFALQALFARIVRSLRLRPAAD